MSDKKSDTSWFLKIVLALSFIIVIIAAYIMFVTDSPSKARKLDVQKEVELGGHFLLTDQDGEKFDSDSLKGKYSLIYFGFTYCPDVCPKSLEKIKLVLDTLSKYQIPINAVFVSVDPERDSSDILKSYLAHFDKRIIGLRGSDIEVRRVTNLYKVYYKKLGEHDDRNYMVDHSSFIYLLDKNGKYIKHFYIDTEAEGIINYIRSSK